MKRLLIGEQHPGMQSALGLLADQVGLELVGLAPSPDHLWELVRAEPADLLIVSDEFLGANPAYSLQGLRKLSPALAVVVVTGATADYEQADLCIHRDDPPDLVINRLRKLTSRGNEPRPGSPE